MTAPGPEWAVCPQGPGLTPVRYEHLCGRLAPLREGKELGWFAVFEDPDDALTFLKALVRNYGEYGGAQFVLIPWWRRREAYMRVGGAKLLDAERRAHEDHVRNEEMDRQNAEADERAFEGRGRR
jgi:hypothetical protein